MAWTLDYRDFSSGASLASVFDQAPEAAVAFFRDKGLAPTFNYTDMVAEEHVAAFSVAKMMDVDLLADVQQAVEDAIVNGETPADFRKRLIPHLQKKGWWGKAEVTDPSTGAKTQAQLGSAARLNTIYRSNVQAAYSAGQWQTIREQKEAAPFLMYDAVDDHRTRPAHAAWDNTVLPVDDPWWDRHYPPNGFNCRCGVIQLDEQQTEAMGLKPSSSAPPTRTVPWTNPDTGEVEQVPRGIDRGWDYHIGKARQTHLEQVLSQKIAALPATMQNAAPAVQELADKAWTQGKKVADEQLANLDPDTVAMQQLKDIEANQEPWLAPALKQVNKTKKGQDMTPSEKLAAVQAKAEKSEQSAYLSAYKKAKLAGKTPSDKAIAAYNNLPDEAQADLDASIESQLAQAAKLQAAEDELAKIEQGADDVPPFKTQELAKMKEKGEADGMGPIALVDELDARYLAHKEKKQKANALSGYKKKVVADKIPTPTQKAAFDALDEDEAEQFLAKIEKAKSKQLQEAADAGDVEAKVQLIVNQADAELPPGPHEAAIKQLAEGEPLGEALEKQLAETDYTPEQTNLILDRAQQAANAKGNGKATAQLILDDFQYTPTDAPDISPPGAQAATGGDTAADVTDQTDDAVLKATKNANVGLQTEGRIGAFANYVVSPTADTPPSDVLFAPAELPTEKRHALWGDLLTIAKAQGNYDQAKAKLVDVDKVPDSVDPGPPTPPVADAPEPEPPPQVVPEADIHPESLTKIGAQKGSNPGGTYQDTETGQKWYIKQPDSEEVARNEVLAGKLYEAAGAEVPRLEMVEVDGTRSIASQIIEGLDTGAPGTDWGDVDGAHSQFMVDAWLGNWDVVGLDYDNLLIKGGRAVRVDTGGALRFRAQGGLKSDAAFGDTVAEIETLRDPSMNAQSAQVFKSLSHEDMVAGARKVARITDGQIDDLVKQYGPRDIPTAEALSAKLKARRDDILERFPEARTRPEAEPGPDSDGALLTRTEQDEVIEARANGITRPTDGGDVEDQQVLLWQELDPDSNPVTAASVRARPGSAWAEQLKRSAASVTGGDSGPKAPSTADIDEQMLAAVKGINSNPTVRKKDVERVQRSRQLLDTLESQLDAAVNESRITKATRDQVASHYRTWLQTLENGVAEGVDGATRPTTEQFGGYGTIPVRQPEDSAGLQWTKKDGVYPAYTTERGFLKRKAGETVQFKQAGTQWEYYLETEVEGVRVRYYPDAKDVSVALRNRLDVYADGDPSTAADRIDSALRTLGLDTRRATAEDSRERFYAQLVHARGIGRAKVEAALAKPAQAERIDALRETLRQDMTAEQFAKLDSAGEAEYPPFGQARPEYMRTDLNDSKGKQWMNKNRFIHESTNPVTLFKGLIGEGGYFHAKSDFFRRGKDFTQFGMSPKPDMQAGGGNYVYTGAGTKGTTAKKVGLTWNGDLARRVDARGHRTDPIGEVGDNIRTHLRDGDDFTGKRASSHYEWIFKHGLSLYSHGFKLQLASQQQVDEVLQWLRQQGEPFASNQWPDGRTLEEVVVVRG